MKGPPLPISEERHGFAGALPSAGGLGAMSGPPCRSNNLRGLPGDHAPLATGLGVDRQVTDREALLLAIPLHVHLRHAVDEADVSVHARPSLAGRDPAIVGLAGAEVGDVLGLRLLARG